jgi:translation initiation factor IF-2
MTDVTVKELANIIGTPEDLLLSQMHAAGLSQSSSEQKVSDEEKQQLLTYLKQSHGETASAPKKITLKRKSTLKVAGSTGRGKTIKVEVRKKRTYVKRPQSTSAQKAEQSDISQPQQPAAHSETVVKASEPQQQVTATSTAFDPELARRKATEVAQQKAALAEAERKAKETERKAQEEAERRAKEQQDIANQQAAAKQTSKAKTSARPDSTAVAPAAEQEDDKLKRGKGKKKLKPAGKQKPILMEDEFWEAEEVWDKTTKVKTTQPINTAIPLKTSTQHAFIKPAKPLVHQVVIPETIKVAELAQKMSVKAPLVIKELMKMGTMATINQDLDQETAALVVEEMGHIAKLQSAASTEAEESLVDEHAYQGETQSRAPIVTIMGHVDHGKTSLLDYIRRTKVTSGEAGGITQHIGAYHVETKQGIISFLDTPGHAAFTAMRARGAQCTDIVVLVVAADDGVMPQTEEAITHAQAAGVPIVVAVNKVDKPEADIERIRNELSRHNIIPEDWGGDNQFVAVSAKTGTGIDELLEAILLQAELLELKACPSAPAKGIIIESRLDRARGPVATLLVQDGTLYQSDTVLSGQAYGRVRAMLNELGQTTRSAGPSIPVEVLGLNEVPGVGEKFLVVASEKKAREVALLRRDQQQQSQPSQAPAPTLENLFAAVADSQVNTLNIVLKTDVRGSLEALISALTELSTDEVKVKIIASGVGGISETDASLAAASSAIILGFNVRADNQAKLFISHNKLDLRYYSIIYDLVNDVKQALTGMLTPEFKEQIVGIADVREVFRSPKFGQVAGCMVVEGSIHRNKKVRVLRDNVVIFEGELNSLRRFKEDVSEVKQGTECGVGVHNYNDIKVGDKIEVFESIQVARTL